MNKRKIVTLLVAGTLTVGVVGGTLAYFTSQDSVVNQFETKGGNIGDDPNSGIDINEYFPEQDKLLPGDTRPKLVQVKNLANYDQFIRVKLTPKWMNLDRQGNHVDVSKDEKPSWWLSETSSPDINVVKLNFSENAFVDGENGYWLKGNDDYYYFIGKVRANNENGDLENTLTTSLLRSVSLELGLGNEYKNAIFDVDVDAEAVQAKNSAFAQQFKDAGDAVLSKLADLQEDNIDSVGVGNEQYKGEGTKTQPTSQEVYK